MAEYWGDKLVRNLEIRGDPSEMVETTDDGRMVVSGYAARYNEPTVMYTANGGTYMEVIKPGAFDEAHCRTNRCCLRYNHDKSGVVLARTRGGSLELTPDDVGLRFRATLFNTTAARDVYEVIKEGGLTEMSFAFVTNKTDPDYVEYDRATRTRSIKRIRELFDVSIVDNPAYETGTSVGIEARDAFSAEAEADAAEAAERAETVKTMERKIALYRMEEKIRNAH